MKSRIRIALAQMSMAEAPQENLEKSLDCLRRAARQEADLVLFPEGQFGPYFPQYPRQDASRYRMALDDPLLTVFRLECQRHRLLATANIYLAEAPKNYSATVFIGRNGEIMGVSRKVHITCVPSFYEQHYFDPGEVGFPVYATDAGQIGVVICYDRHYPESARACALQNAQLVIVPTANISTENLEMFAWEMRVAAFQNHLFIAMCNRVGQEGAMTFAGNSLLIDPDGQLLKIGGADEEMMVMELDLDQTARSRQERPYLSLRHPRLGQLW